MNHIIIKLDLWSVVMSNVIISFFDSLKNFSSSGYKLVSDEIFEERLDICKECPDFNSAISQCRQCGCLLSIKAKWASEKCPLDKWESKLNIISENHEFQSTSDCNCNKK